MTYEERRCSKCKCVTFFGKHYVRDIGWRWVCVECGHQIKRKPMWGVIRK